MIRHPQWMDSFVDRILTSVTQLGTESDVGGHVFQNIDGEWEVTLFQNSEISDRLENIEELRGAMSINVFDLVRVFDDVRSCRWQSAPVGWDDDLGAHLSIEGSYHGETIWLRMTARLPSCLNEPMLHDTAPR